MSPAELREQSTECVEVTEEEFKSVSSLIRGRVNLVDVNKVGFNAYSLRVHVSVVSVYATEA